MSFLPLPRYFFFSLSLTHIHTYTHAPALSRYRCRLICNSDERCKVPSKIEWSPCGSILATTEVFSDQVTTAKNKKQHARRFFALIHTCNAMQQSGNCIRLWAADCLSSASVDHNGTTQIGKPSHRLPLVSINWRQFTSGIEVQVLRWSPCGGRLFAAFESVSCIISLCACIFFEYDLRIIFFWRETRVSDVRKKRNLLNTL